jgi:hypothetical protein
MRTVSVASTGRLATLALSVASFALAAHAEPGASGRPTKRAESCFWVHGRLFAANGAPTFRIWPIGTKRILGVRGAHGSADPLPAPVRALAEPDAFQVDLYGDYRVCALTQERPGHMRFVRIMQARRLVARPAASRGPAD